MTQPMTLDGVAKRALDGDRDAVEQLVRDLQSDIYGLALRMLWNREDAEDATQEILVRTVTRLSQFDFRSKLKTWVYRIAVNYIPSSFANGSNTPAPQSSRSHARIAGWRRIRRPARATAECRPRCAPAASARMRSTLWCRQSREFLRRHKIEAIVQPLGTR